MHTGGEAECVKWYSASLLSFLSWLSWKFNDIISCSSFVTAVSSVAILERSSCACLKFSESSAKQNGDFEKSITVALGNIQDVEQHYKKKIAPKDLSPWGSLKKYATPLLLGVEVAIFLPVT